VLFRLLLPSLLPPLIIHHTGDNALESAPSGRVTDFVRSQGGHTVITKVR